MPDIEKRLNIETGEEHVVEVPTAAESYVRALVEEFHNHNARNDARAVADVLAELSRVAPEVARQFAPKLERAVSRAVRETRRA